MPAIFVFFYFRFRPWVVVPRDKLGGHFWIASPIGDLVLVEFNNCFPFYKVLWTTLSKDIVVLSLQNALVDSEFMCLTSSFSVNLEEHWTLIEFPAIFSRILATYGQRERFGVEFGKWSEVAAKFSWDLNEVSTI